MEETEGDKIMPVKNLKGLAGRMSKLKSGAGRPRTEAERKIRHKKLYGSSKLPPRGTGLQN